MFDTVGTNTGGVVQLTPSQQRPTLTPEQIAALPIYGALNVPNTVLLCTVAECSSGTMAMFTDAYTNGANGGYIEFGLCWPNAENAINGWSGGQMDGGADFSDFYLVVTEDNTPGDTSYC